MTLKNLLWPIGIAIAVISGPIIVQAVLLRLTGTVVHDEKHKV